MSNKLMLKFSPKRRIGNIGEDLAEMFLVKNGFKILERNYLKKWGELDVIAKKNNLIHFIEVKSKVSREIPGIDVSRDVSHQRFTLIDAKDNLSRESNDDEYMPEDNVHFWKQKRMVRAIQTYILERNVDEDQEWQIDVLTVSIDFFQKTAIIKHIENVVFDI
jgi:putative endonuclease